MDSRPLDATAFDPTLAKRVTPEWEKLFSCMQCGTCSSPCPTAYAMDYTPRQRSPTPPSPPGWRPAGGARYAASACQQRQRTLQEGARRNKIRVRAMDVTELVWRSVSTAEKRQ
jgi:ferredoxin